MMANPSMCFEPHEDYMGDDFLECATQLVKLTDQMQAV